MAADNDKAKIVLDGDISPFRQKLREAANELNRFGAGGKARLDGLSGPLDFLTGKFKGLAAAISVGGFAALIKSSIDAADNLHDLAQRTGMSVETLSGLRLVADQSGTSLESLGISFKKLSVNLVDAAAGNKEMAKIFAGLNITGDDAQAAMYRLADVMATLPDGAQKTALAVKLLGRSAEEMIPLLNQGGAELRKMIERGRELAGITTEMAAEADQLNDQLAELKVQAKAAGVSMAKDMLPALSNIAAAMRVAAKESGILKAVWVGLGGVGAAIFTDEFAGAKEKIKNLQVEIQKLSANKKLVEGGGLLHRWLFGDAKSLDAKIKAKMEQIEALKQSMIAPPKPPELPKTPAVDVTKLMSEPRKTERKSPLPDSYMSTYEARLAEIKNVYEQENALRQFGKEQELAYWRAIQQTLQVTAQDRLAITKRTATLEVEIRRQAAKEQREIDAVMLDHRRAEGLAQVQLAEQQARFARENGEITQRELLVLEEEYARRRFEIEYQSLLERLELAKNDPATSPAALLQIKEQMLEIERQYQLKRGEIGQDKRKEENSFGAVWDDAGQAFGNMANNLLTQATTLRQQLAGVFQSIYQSFVQNLVTKPLGEWIAGQARLLAVKMGWLAKDKAIDAAAATATVAAKTTESTAVVTANAAEAGSGAAASQAAIPIIGPALALASMAAVFGAVMALTSRKSAMRGYSIPKGLNPVTQLHEEEMVLPKQYANLIRTMAQERGEGGAGPAAVAPVIQVHAMNSRDVVRALQEGGALNRALRDAYRSFAFTPPK